MKILGAVAILLGLLLVVSVAQTAYATDATSPLELALQDLQQGKDQEARAKLDTWLERDLTSLKQAQMQDPTSSVKLGEYADQLRNAVFLANTWQSAELWLAAQHSQSGAPEQVVKRLLDAGDELEAHSLHLLQQGGNLQQAPDIQKKIDQATEDTGAYLMRSNVFVKGTVYEQQRQSYIDRARALLKPVSIGAPGKQKQKYRPDMSKIVTVEDFDDLYGNDPTNTLSFIPKPSPKNKQTPEDATKTNSGAQILVESDMQQLIENGLQLFVAGQINTWEQLFVNNTLPRKTEVQSEAQELQGWSFDSLGPIEARKLDSGDIAVHIAFVNLRNPQGEIRRENGSDFVIRKVGEEYRFVSID